MEKGFEIVKSTYIVVKKLPVEEKFGIISQMTRAAVSIPLNIAEGSGRGTDKAYAKFLRFSLGSAFELKTYLIIIEEMGCVSEADIKELNGAIESEIKMLHTFIKRL